MASVYDSFRKKTTPLERMVAVFPFISIFYQHIFGIIFSFSPFSPRLVAFT
jgi:hypothetical protein